MCVQATATGQAPFAWCDLLSSRVLLEIKFSHRATSRVCYSIPALRHVLVPNIIAADCIIESLLRHVHALVAAGADLHSPVFPIGLTPLTCAISHACHRTVEAMLLAKCDPNPELNGVGYGPLHSAAGFSRENKHAVEITRVLLSHGADLNLQARPCHVFKILSWAARAYFHVVNLECSSMMSLKVLASLPGLTPVGFAALLGDGAVTQVLVDAGAEMLTNDRGDSLSDLAMANLHETLLPSLSALSV